MLGMRVLVVFAALMFAAQVRAGEIQVMGRAEVPITKDANATRAAATAQARRNAVVAAVEKVLGPGASRDPRIGNKIDSVVAQVPDSAYVDAKSQAVSGQYQMSVTMVVDDKTFRTLLSDLGIAVSTSTVRGAAAILTIMDEYITTPKDIRAPLEELTEYRSNSDARYRERSHASESSASSSSSRSGHSASVDAHHSTHDGWDGYHDHAGVHGRDSGYASDSASGRHSASASGSVAADQHDSQYYFRLVRYQPQNRAPERISQTWNAIAGQLQDYDLRLIDNDQFRSKYFRNHPMTLDELQNGAVLAKYVSYAKNDAKADFFMVGTSVIIDSGRNSATGDMECNGVVSLKTYSTVDGESIASETVSEVSSGRNLDDCSANLAKKLASFTGPIIGARVQEYWKRRETYGREIVLTLKGVNLPLRTRAAFVKAVKSLPGVEGETQQRASDASMVQLVVTYKGADPLDQAVAMQLGADKDFENLDSRTEANQIVLCMGPCAKVERRPK
jgi:hypothetical protein